MPVTFNKDGNGKKIIYTKITGVKGSSERAVLSDKHGNSWNLYHKMISPLADEKTNVTHVLKGTKIVLTINGDNYDRKSMGKSMFSVIDYASHLMISRQKILRYMYLYPERIINVFRNPKVFGEIQAKIEINNYDDSVFELTCSLGNIDVAEYSKELSGPHKLNEWMITGIEQNRTNPMMSLGCNIGIELFDN